MAQEVGEALVGSKGEPAPFAEDPGGESENAANNSEGDGAFLHDDAGADCHEGAGRTKASKP